MLRDYQTEAKRQVNTLLNARRNPCLVLPTGTGKTKTGCEIIKDRIDLKKRVYVIVPSVEVFNQWILSLLECGINAGYINDEGVRGQDRWCYVCMPISLLNNLGFIHENMFPHEIVFDECHHNRCETWLDIIKFFDNPPLLGLTATPRRTDGKSLSMYTDIVNTIDMQEAVNRGYLAKPLVIVPDEFYKNVKIPQQDIDTNSGLQKQAEYLGKAQIIGDVIKSYSRVFHGLPVLVACSTTQHAEFMTQKFNDAGWKFEHIHSSLPNQKRSKMLKDIRNHKINGLCTVGIGIEGMDIPGLYGLIFLRRTMSVTIYLQFIGRVLRPMKGKKYGIVLDFVGNLFIHGFPDTKRNWTLDGKEEVQKDDTSPIKVCCFCGVVNAESNAVCHMCGFSFKEELDFISPKKRKLPVMIDGDLVALTSEGEIHLKQEVEKEMAKSSEKEQQKRIEAEKAQMVKHTLFSGMQRRKLFYESLQNLTK